MKLLEILAANKAFKKSIKEKPLKIGVLGNISVHSLKPILEYELSLKNSFSEVTILGFNNFIEESIKKDFDIYLFFWETINLSENFKSEYYHFSESEKKALFEKTITELEISLKQLQSNSLVIFNSFSEFTTSTGPLGLDSTNQLSKRLNEHLNCIKQENLLVLNLDFLIQNCGIEKTFDYRTYYQSSSLYTNFFLIEYSKIIVPLIENRKGKQKKMIVLDADNTLWKGIIGEDGIEGIKCIPGTLEGMIYYEVQSLLKDLKNKGVLLAICSKNNPSDIEKMFNKNIMFLKQDDFVIKKINWSPKNHNIQEIANEINIGLDSIVFIDDSDFEIQLIKSTLPQVNTVQVPKTLSNYPETIKKLYPLFFSGINSNEDKHKTRMYLDENERKKKSLKYKNIDDYINSLGLELLLSKNRQIPIERCTQLTQKTNQFNFTTKRYSRAELEQLILKENWHLISLSIKDKFGDYGTTGLIILTIDNDKATIDTFLLSCRVLGRKIENIFFKAVIDELKLMNVKQLIGVYVPTKKNIQVKGFYKNMGMKINTFKNSMTTYVLNTNDFKNKENLNFKIK